MRQPKYREGTHYIVSRTGDGAVVEWCETGTDGEVIPRAFTLPGATPADTIIVWTRWAGNRLSANRPAPVPFPGDWFRG